MSHIDIAAGNQSGTNWSSVFGVVGGIFLVALCLVAAYFAFRWFNANRGGGASTSMDLGDRKKIRNHIESGNYEAAGDLYLKAGSLTEAAETFMKAGSFIKAAKTFQQAGNHTQAVHCFKKAGEFSQAAQVYATMGQHMAAAAEYFQAGEYEASAIEYEKAEDWRRAAETYEKVKNFRRAGELYEKAGDEVRAAENFAHYFEDAMSRQGGLDEIGEDRAFALRAGKAFQELGDFSKASQIFEQAGYLVEAADALRESGELARAAQLYMRASEPLKAAQILEEAGEDVQAAKMRAEAALKSGDLRTAAERFRQAGDLERAVGLLEECEAWGDAAEVREELGDLEKAMELYERVERFGNAARCAESLGRLERASELYRQAQDLDGEIRVLVQQGDFFRAGRLQFEHRRHHEALETLQNIDSRDPIYPRAIELQGDILRAQGRFEKAYSRYRAALGMRDCNPSTLALFYKMGRVLEDEQDRTGALEHYNAILAVDKTYEDVSVRVKGLLGRGRKSTVPGTTSSGIFAAPDGVEGPRYEILEEVARGGMGIVYKARDTVLGRVVAFKILGENLRDNETAVKYFLREARAAAALSHPNIVTIFDAGEQDGEYYMAMEFVEGTTLKELIKKKGALPEDQVRYILVHCCRALQYAHSKGVIHRDIKSGNVMITREKALKIMDFGLAKFMREYQKEHTQQVGTPFYMSPEQIIGKNIDFRSDLYSLGCTIFECATGTVPFFKGDLSYHHVHTRPPTPRSINSTLSKDLERVILKMLEKNPDARYQSAKEIADAIMSPESA